jgi:hypothetical protein
VRRFGPDKQRSQLWLVRVRDAEQLDSASLAGAFEQMMFAAWMTSVLNNGTCSSRRFS